MRGTWRRPAGRGRRPSLRPSLLPNSSKREGRPPPIGRADCWLRQSRPTGRRRRQRRRAAWRRCRRLRSPSVWSSSGEAPSPPRWGEATTTGMAAASPPRGAGPARATVSDGLRGGVSFRRASVSPRRFGLLDERRLADVALRDDRHVRGAVDGPLALGQVKLAQDTTGIQPRYNRAHPSSPKLTRAHPERAGCESLHARRTRERRISPSSEPGSP